MKGRRSYVWVMLCIIPGLFASCELIDPSEKEPTIIHLEPFEFEIQPGQGTSDNRITEVWVFANGNNLGAFTPPVNIHYLEEGPTRLNLRPGVRNNGIGDDAIIYPMFQHDSIDIVASPGSYHEVHPKTRYKDGVVFKLIADFELNNDFTDNRDTIEASQLIQSQADVFEGSYSGQITMTSEANFIDVGNSIALTGLPVNGKPVYLEMRYKNEVEFAIGILGIDLNGNSFSNFFYLVKPSDEWNMLYLELTDQIQASSFSAYKILFQAIYPNAATKPPLNIFMDNIKVVHL